MEEKNHRINLHSALMYLRNMNKGALYNDELRLYVKSRYWKCKATADHYLMKPEGKIVYKCVSAINTNVTSEFSSDDEFMNEHCIWFDANKQLLSLGTFIGRKRTNTWKYLLPLNERPDVVGLMDMPLEVFENLVWYIDGISFHNLCRASPVLNAKLNEALNDKQYDAYWESRRDLDFDHVEKLVMEDARLKSPNGEDINYAETFKVCANLDDIIEESTLCLESLDTLENALRADMKLGFTYHYPKKITVPCGRMLCTIFSETPDSYNDENIIIMEDMNPKKVFRKGSVCQHTCRITAVHVMALQQNHKSTVNLIITICHRCICVFPIMEGNGCVIDLGQEDENGMHNCGTIAPVNSPSNVNRNILGVFVSFKCVELYRMSFTDMQAGAQKMHKINLLGFQSFWMTFYENPSSFMTVVTDIDFSCATTAKEEDLHCELPRILPPCEKGYGLSVISFHFGHLLIRPKSFALEHTVEYSSACKMSALYYMDNYEMIDTMKYPVGCCSGCGMNIFWSDETIAVSEDKVTWHLKSFRDGIRSRSSKQRSQDWSDSLPARVVTSIEICAPGLILVAIDKELVFLRLKLEVPQVVGTSLGFPQIEWNVIRRIDFDLAPLNLSLRSLHFDFGHGNPYIFIELHDSTQLGNALKFRFKKILLKREHTTEDSGYLSHTEN